MNLTPAAEPCNKQQKSLSPDDAKDQVNAHTHETKPKPMSAQDHAGQSCLQLKGSLVPMTVLELNYYDAAQFNRDLQAKTAQAPDFFENLPIVLSLEKLDEHEQLSFDQLIETCLQFSIKVVAVRGGNEHQQAAAKQAGLGILAKQKEHTTDPEPPTISPIETAKTTESAEQADTKAETPEKAEPLEASKPVADKERQISKVVQHPIRSGQQVYAADGDLIVLASVSAGAEILADGNIHVYGALRGRALAGVKGDTKARIFCHSLQAELVSIAGQYRISEDIEHSIAMRPVQVFLDKNSLCIKEIEL